MDEPEESSSNADRRTSVKSVMGQLRATDAVEQHVASGSRKTMQRDRHNRTTPHDSSYDPMSNSIVTCFISNMALGYKALCAEGKKKKKKTSE
jgi:hypothetical protein